MLKEYKISILIVSNTRIKRYDQIYFLHTIFLAKGVQKWRRSKKKVLYQFGLPIILGTILLLEVSYAWLSLTLTGTNTNVLKAGTLSLILDDASGSEIQIEKAVPMLDEVGEMQTPYHFNLTNNGTDASEYTIYLDDAALSSEEIKLPDSVIKYNLVKNDRSIATELLTTTGINPNRVLDTGMIAPGASYTYDLRLWLDENTTNSESGKIFRGKIRVEASQLNYTTDGLLVWYDGRSRGNTANVWQDLSAHHNDGIITTSNSWTEDGLLLDGNNNYVNVGLSNYDFQDQITYAIRLKFHTIKDADFFGNWESAGGGLAIMENKLLFQLSIANHYQNVFATSLDLELDKFYMIVGTYDGSRMTLYVDNEKVGDLVISGNVKTINLPILLGANPYYQDGKVMGQKKCTCYH